MASDQAKQALFEAIALMGKAFASPRRLELLDLLAQGPRGVEELARESGQSTANASQHLQALHASGMVTRTREGTRVVYAIAGEEVLALWLALRDASAAQLGEVERAARDYLGDEVETIGREELRKRLEQGDIVLVDVRPEREFDAGHIEGARSIPIEELERRLDELPADREIVAYCRGPFCAYAHDAVRRLESAGRRAGRSGTWRHCGRGDRLLRRCRLDRDDRALRKLVPQPPHHAGLRWPERRRAQKFVAWPAFLNRAVLRGDRPWRRSRLARPAAGDGGNGWGRWLSHSQASVRLRL